MSQYDNVTFKVIIDESLLNIDTKNELKPSENKHLLSIVNDFEDKCWRFERFDDFIFDHIVDASLSEKERQKLLYKPASALREAAKKLKLTDKNKFGKGSELAEIVLYGIMREHYSALPVVPKIFYKQNINDNTKGADSVHIVTDNNGGFSIWFGEAKFYSSIKDHRFPEIIKSIHDLLKTDKLRKENSIVTNVSDIQEFPKLPKSTKDKILKILDEKTSIDELKPILNIPILLLHECEITKDITELSDEYKTRISNFHKERAKAFFKKQIERLSDEVHQYSKITFHLILFPVPEKERIVKRFLGGVKHYRR